jgi:hypothetical protein
MPVSLDELSVVVIFALAIYSTGFLQKAGEDSWEALKRFFRKRR